VDVLFDGNGHGRNGDRRRRNMTRIPRDLDGLTRRLETLSQSFMKPVYIYNYVEVGLMWLMIMMSDGI
jgi:hypothetical protein